LKNASQTNWCDKNFLIPLLEQYFKIANIFASKKNKQQNVYYFQPDPLQKLMHNH